MSARIQIPTRPIHRHVLALAGVIVFLAASGVVTPTAALATPDDECISSKLTNELLDCAHCTAMKKLLGHRAIGAVTMEVHDLEQGAVIELEGSSPASVSLIHEMVEEIWVAQGHCDTELSSMCQKRFHQLRLVAVDKALTSHGALVILRADDPELIDWLRDDAHTTQSIVLSAAAR